MAAMGEWRDRLCCLKLMFTLLYHEVCRCFCACAVEPRVCTTMESPAEWLGSGDQGGYMHINTEVVVTRRGGNSSRRFTDSR